MKCCDVQVKCPRCGQGNEYVHLSFKNGNSQGFGCLACGTAIQKGEEYVRKDNETEA